VGAQAPLEREGGFSNTTSAPEGGSAEANQPVESTPEAAPVQPADREDLAGDSLISSGEDVASQAEAGTDEVVSSDRTSDEE